ncbi:hypothetical protein TNCV_4782711 [Trichonephila clavipes]|nr:hypothetical protein TNCV_4782711 [Trichonephila clavipes]
MQPDLRKLICEHIIRGLQHQKDVNQKQHICVKHDFVVSNHTITVNLHSRFELTPSRRKVVFLELFGIENSAFLLAAAFADLFVRILAPDSVENRR